jgi:hypothetical protein
LDLLVHSFPDVPDVDQAGHDLGVDYHSEFFVQFERVEDSAYLKLILTLLS